MFYTEKYPVGSEVRIADRDFLAGFLQSWKFHHPLDPVQISFAGKPAKVEKVGFYHGGDVLYNLCGVPGIWHEERLRPMQTMKRDS
jgi:hypothetical protein